MPLIRYPTRASHCGQGGHSYLVREQFFKRGEVAYSWPWKELVSWPPLQFVLTALLSVLCWWLRWCNFVGESWEETWWGSWEVRQEGRKPAIVRRWATCAQFHCDPVRHCVGHASELSYHGTVKLANISTHSSPSLAVVYSRGITSRENPNSQRKLSETGAQQRPQRRPHWGCRSPGALQGNDRAVTMPDTPLEISL
jgi:hypothetical protein